MPKPKLKLMGKKFGKLSVTEKVKERKNGDVLWKCVCECGNLTEVRGRDLKRGNTKSCGCVRGYHTHRLCGTKTYRMWKDAKTRAKKQNVPFTITAEDVRKLVDEAIVCPLLGVPLNKNGTKRADNIPSLDKIIPKDGYTPNNSWIVSWRANQLKSDASIQELKTLTENFEKVMIQRAINETR